MLTNINIKFRVVFDLSFACYRIFLRRPFEGSALKKVGWKKNEKISLGVTYWETVFFQWRCYARKKKVRDIFMRFLKKRIGLNIKHRLLNLKKIEHKHTIDFFFKNQTFQKRIVFLKLLRCPYAQAKIWLIMYLRKPGVKEVASESPEKWPRGLWSPWERFQGVSERIWGAFKGFSQCFWWFQMDPGSLRRVRKALTPPP